MTADELRKLQRKCDRDAERAILSARARNAAVHAALAEGRTQRWVAAALGVSHGRVGQIVAGGSGSADS